MKRKNPQKKTETTDQKALREGYRSGLEGIIAEQILRETGEEVRYEPKDDKIKYEIPSSLHTYTYDFQLPNGIIIETKGRFTPADRKKHLLIKQQHPERDIRFVFSNANARLSKGSPTTYAKWCEKHGFKYAHRWIPKAWFTRDSIKDTLLNRD